METAILADGCFWGMQHLLRRYPGVIATPVGGDLAVGLRAGLAVAFVRFGRQRAEPFALIRFSR